MVALPRHRTRGLQIVYLSLAGTNDTVMAADDGHSSAGHRPEAEPGRFGGRVEAEAEPGTLKGRTETGLRQG